GGRVARGGGGLCGGGGGGWARARVVGGVGLSGLGGGGVEEGGGAGGVDGCGRRVPPPLPQDAQVLVGVGLCGLVAGVGGQVQGAAELGVGVVEAAQHGVGVGEDAVGAGLRGRVGQPLGGGHRGAADGGPVVPVPPPVEESRQSPGKLPGVGVEPGHGGLVDGGQQHGVLQREPVQGLLVVGGVLRGDVGCGRGEGDRVRGRVQQSVGGVRGVQVVVEDADGGGVALLVGIDAVGERGGVGAQQVVEGIPAGNVLD